MKAFSPMDAATEAPRQKPVTMEVIARRAGVHSRTVADALKGTGRVAPATREKVLRIARELNYVPNAAARALATGRTGSIAVLSGPLNEPFYANIVHLLEAHLTADGYEIALLHTKRELSSLVQATQSSLVDGVIVIVCEHTPEEFLRLRGASAQPCVVIDTSRRDFVDHITLDLRPAVEQALRLMLAAGRRRVAYVINNCDEAAHTEVRMQTYLRVMEEAGQAPELIDVNTRVSSEARVQSIKAYIEAQGCPDALLVGCDGLPYMAFFDPPLSTIVLPTEEICATAARFLQQRLATPELPIQEATLRGQLMIRKSLQSS